MDTPDESYRRGTQSRRSQGYSALTGKEWNGENHCKFLGGNLFFLCLETCEGPHLTSFLLSQQCICNRIEYDRQRLGEKSEFSQLFVSRSNRLCVYVENAVGSNRQSEFHTFDNLLHELDVSLSEEERSTGFNQRQRVGFAQFKQFYDERYPQEKIAALIVWKAIRTFTKGSIEAFQSSARVLSREYFVSDKLGKNRCKVPIDLRGRIYEIFVQYQSWLKELNLWDDCDRIHCLLQQIEEAKRTDSVVYEKVKWGKIYVDVSNDLACL